MDDDQARYPAYVPFGASVLGGLLVCLAVSMATGRREAWDLALGHEYGRGPSTRTRDGGTFTVAVAAF